MFSLASTRSPLVSAEFSNIDTAINLNSYHLSSRDKSQYRHKIASTQTRNHTTLGTGAELVKWANSQNKKQKESNLRFITATHLFAVGVGGGGVRGGGVGGVGVGGLELGGWSRGWGRGGELESVVGVGGVGSGGLELGGGLGGLGSEGCSWFEITLKVL